MKKLIALLAILLCCSQIKAQNIEGQIIAAQFGSYQVPGISTGSLTFEPATCQVVGGGKNFSAFTTGVPVKIVDSNPNHSEIGTPTAVFPSQCAISMSTTYLHATPFYATSGTGGLQEAIINGPVRGGGPNTILLTADWYTQVAPGNPATVIAAVHGNSTLPLVDVTTSPYTWYAWDGTKYSNAGTFSLPAATAAGQVLTSTAAGTNYTAQNTPSLPTASGSGQTPVSIGAGTTYTAQTLPTFPSSGIVNANSTSTSSAATSAQIAAALNTSPSTILATALIPKATSSALGTVVPDNSTTFVSAGGVLSAASSGGTPGGVPTTVQYNNSSAFGGDATFSFNSTTKYLNFQNAQVSPLNTAITGTNYNSGQQLFQGSYCTGSPTCAPTGDYYGIQSIMGSGVNPTTLLNFSHSGSGSGLADFNYLVNLSAGAFTTTAATGDNSTTVATTASVYANMPMLSAAYFGAKGDAIKPPNGCTVTASSTTVTCADGPFTSTAVDGGKQFWEQGGGAAGVAFHTTIATVTNSTTAVLAATATTTVTGGVGIFGTDDVAALQSCFAYSAAHAIQCALTSPTGYLIGSGSVQLVDNNSDLENSATTIFGASHVKGTNLYCEFNGPCMTMAAGPIQGARIAGLTFQEDPTQPNSQGMYFQAQAGTFGNGGLFNATFDSVEVDNPAKECLLSQGGGGVGYTFNLPNQYVTFNQFNCNLPNQMHTANGIKLIGQHAQIVFINGAVNGISYTLTPNWLIYIGELTGGLGDSPTDVKFFGYTYEVGNEGLFVGEGSSNIHYDNSYIENVHQPYSSTNANGGTFNGNHIANSGDVTGIIQLGGNVNMSARDNYFYGTANPDAAFAVCTNNTNFLDMSGNFAGTSNTLATSSCATAQLSVTSSTLTLAGGNTNFVGGSATTITTLANAGTNPGHTVTIYAASSPGLTFGTGGNINFGGLATPLTVANGSAITFTLFDLGPTWLVTSVSSPSGIPTLTGTNNFQNTNFFSSTSGTTFLELGPGTTPGSSFSSIYDDNNLHFDASSNTARFMVFSGNSGGNIAVWRASAGGSNLLAFKNDGGVAPSAYDQIAATTTGGTCAMSTSTSCTITIAHTYSTPVCIVTQQSATLTGAADGCTVSGTTVTVHSATANSETWGAFVFGNPN